VIFVRSKLYASLALLAAIGAVFGYGAANGIIWP
jgi:hypothetical protein